jgi:PAS domain S-box-containing protein
MDETGIHTPDLDHSAGDRQTIVTGAELFGASDRIREQAPESQRECEAKFRLLFDNHPVPMWVYDRDTLRFLEVNDAAITRYGYSRDEFLGLRITDIRPVEDIPLLEESLAGKRSRLTHSGPWRHRRKDGRIIDVEIASHAIDWSGHRATLVVAKDISDRQRVAVSLRESEERFRTAFEHAPLGMCLTALDGRYLQVNTALTEMLGYTEQELLEGAWQTLTHPADLELSRQATVQFMHHPNTSVDFEKRYIHKSGQSIWVRLRISAVTNSQGLPVHFITHVEDITARRRADEEVRRATRAMRVLSATNQALVRSRDEAGLLRAICEAITDTGGYPLTWIGFVENDDRQSVRIVARSGLIIDYLNSLSVTWADGPLGRGPTGTCIRAGRIATCNDVDTDPGFEPWREKAARHGYRSVIGLPLWCEGAIIGALTIYATEPDAFGPEERDLLQELAGDLSHGIEGHRRRLKQARAEEAILQSAMEFRTLFNSANDAIFIVDLEGRILELNEVACQQLGYSRAELANKTIDEIEPLECRALLPMRRAQELERGQSLFETVHVRKDGSELPVEISARLFDYRHAPAILSVARDISERKKAEAQALRHAAELERAKTEAENANRVKSEFLANMSHEIRTPMNGILGVSGLLLDTPLTPDQREYSEMIRKSADALLAIVNDVLDLSKIEAGKIEIEPVRFDILACLAETGELLAPQARAKKLEYIFEKQVEHRWVCGDAGRLRQIVLNLLSNAIKFTERGRVTLRISSSESPGGQAVFSISVTDTGIGIRATDLPLLFNNFTQVDSSLSKQHEGTGLGLAISRRLAELMGGTLTVASELGKGATFELMLVLPLAAEADTVNPSPAFNAAQLAAKCRRVLIAEDNVVNQKIGVRFLEKCGCRVDLAANGREAVEMAQRFPYDLIFMDCRMPEMNGYAATRAIRAQQSQGARVPIVALTAHAISGTREECLAAGMDDYITKPASLSSMQQMLLKWSP